VPSAKTTKGGYLPSFSIILYLSAISSTVCSLASLLAVLAIKIQPIALHNNPKTGIPLSSFLAANEAVY
jgi:hypothetical protein